MRTTTGHGGGRADRYDDEDDDRPIQKKRAKKGTSPIALVAGGIALVLIIGGVVVIGMYVWNNEQNKHGNAPVVGPGTGPGFGPFGPAGPGGPLGPGGRGPIAQDYPWHPILRNPNDEPTVQNPPADEKPAGAATDVRLLLTPVKPGSPLPEAPDTVNLPGETIDRVKRATVYIRVTMDKGIGSGSGFFAAGAKGLVVTNAHVVGMLEADTKPPSHIDVVLNSGQPDEATFRGEVLTVDRGNDLAVLRIHTTDASKNAKLPEPLTVAADARLHETQRVFVFGFPFGEQLGKDITVSQSSVTSLRRSPQGDLHQIQVGGGMNPGNSGGPVVDGAGHIIGVAVAIIKGTGINFAIPAQRVSSVLDGRLSEIHLGEPTPKDGKLTVAVEVDALDPQLASSSWRSIGGGATPRRRCRPVAAAGRNWRMRPKAPFP